MQRNPTRDNIKPHIAELFLSSKGYLILHILLASSISTEHDARHEILFVTDSSLYYPYGQSTH